MKYLFLFTSVLICSGATGQALAQGLDEVAPEWRFEAARQFDFWIGEWDVNLRVRQEDFSWQDKLSSRAKIYRILDGKAILEFWDSATIKGYSLRYYDSEKKKWVIELNWPGKNWSGNSKQGLEGSFRHGRGEFFSTYTTKEGQAGIQRYTFCDITPTSLRWDDAYSEDGGKTWSNNWIMEWTRLAGTAPWPAAGEKAPTYETGARCDRPEFRTFEVLEGKWRGEVETLTSKGKWVKVAADFSGYKVLDGCAVMNFLHYDLDGQPVKSFSIKTFRTKEDANSYEDTRLNNAANSVAQMFHGDLTDGKIALVELERGGEKNVLQKYVWDLRGPNEFNYQVLQSGDDKKSWQRIASGSFQRED